MFKILEHLPYLYKHLLHPMAVADLTVTCQASVSSLDLTQLILKLTNQEFIAVKSAYQNINFLISQAKHMLWVLKRTISMRWFF